VKVWEAKKGDIFYHWPSKGGILYNYILGITGADLYNSTLHWIQYDPQDVIVVRKSQHFCKDFTDKYLDWNHAGILGPKEEIEFIAKVQGVDLLYENPN
jgi:hypothetical protein